MQNRQQQKCHAKRNQVYKNRSMPARNVLKERAQERRERGFAERTQAKARERDANLHAGNDAVEMPEQVQYDSRARIACLHQLPHTRKPHGHERKFHGREESVHGHQRQ